MDKKPFVSVLDLLLRPDLPDVRRELPEKRVEVKRRKRLSLSMSELALFQKSWEERKRIWRLLNVMRESQI